MEGVAHFTADRFTGTDPGVEAGKQGTDGGTGLQQASSLLEVPEPNVLLVQSTVPARNGAGQGPELTVKLLECGGRATAAEPESIEECCRRCDLAGLAGAPGRVAECDAPA